MDKKGNFINYNQSPIDHFKLMGKLASKMTSIPAMVLEHGYSDESFGSWWVIIKKGSHKFRLVFDGRDSRLFIEESVVAQPRQKIIIDWVEKVSKQLSSNDSALVLSESLNLISAL
jgi:hypothetical protein